MELATLFNQMPFAQLLGIRVTEAADGYAEAELPFSDELLSSTSGSVAHGAATYALADTVAGAAVISRSEDISPTVDMRIDYLAPVTTDLEANAEVIRYGSNLAMVYVQVFDVEGTRVATAQGTYKTGGQGTDTPWNNRTNDSTSEDTTSTET